MSALVAEAVELDAEEVLRPAVRIQGAVSDNLRALHIGKPAPGLQHVGEEQFRTVLNAGSNLKVVARRCKAAARQNGISPDDRHLFDAEHICAFRSSFNRRGEPRKPGAHHEHVDCAVPRLRRLDAAGKCARRSER